MKMNQFTDNVSQEKRAELDEAISEFFFSNNIPFAAIESNTFKTMMKTARPAYVVPSRKYLSTTLLDKVNEKMIATDREAIAKSNENGGIILIDGWLNSRISRIV